MNKQTRAALFCGLLSLCSLPVKADVIDDVVGNTVDSISREWNAAMNSSGSADRASDDDSDGMDLAWNDDAQRQQDEARHQEEERRRQYDEQRRQQDERHRQYEDRRRQLEDRRRQIDDQQRQVDEQRRQLKEEQRRLDAEYR